jgi:hypothetical protein
MQIWREACSSGAVSPEGCAKIVLIWRLCHGSAAAIVVREGSASDDTAPELQASRF